MEKESGTTFELRSLSNFGKLHSIPKETKKCAYSTIYASLFDMEDQDTMPKEEKQRKVKSLQKRHDQELRELDNKTDLLFDNIINKCLPSIL